MERLAVIFGALVFVGFISYVVGLGGVPGVFGSAEDAANRTINPQNVAACQNGGDASCGVNLAVSAAGKLVTFQTPHTWLSIVVVALIVAATLAALSFLPVFG